MTTCSRQKVRLFFARVPAPFLVRAVRVRWDGGGTREVSTLSPLLFAGTLAPSPMGRLQVPPNTAAAREQVRFRRPLLSANTLAPFPVRWSRVPQSDAKTPEVRVHSLPAAPARPLAALSTRPFRVPLRVPPGDPGPPPEVRMRPAPL